MTVTAQCAVTASIALTTALMKRRVSRAETRISYETPPAIGRAAIDKGKWLRFASGTSPRSGSPRIWG